MQHLNRKNRKKLEKMIGKTKKKNESISDFANRILVSQQKGIEIHNSYLKTVEEEEFHRNNPQVNEN